jgi:hypothetical protein
VDKYHGVALAVVYVVDFDGLAGGVAAYFDEIHKRKRRMERKET